MKIELINLISLPKNIQLEARNWRNSSSVLPFFSIQYIDEKTHQNWLDSMSYSNPKNFAFAIKVDENFVGMIYLKNVDYENQNCEVGIYIHQIEVRGRGVGGRAFEFIINFAKNNIKLKKLILEVFDFNVNAIKLYKKVGFKYTKNRSDKLLEFELCLS
ncbi:MAG: GNAT family N-acetyltransferase [Proteobacteria bacterium]|nr:GNAT family N-acetyltransferase [Pseudomonadota bacterium]